MSKPSRCKCGGGYKRNKNNWVVVRRRVGMTSQLKCMKCLWKWWSKCYYVSALPDHKERSRSGMTDQDILDRLLDGSLEVDLTTGAATSHTIFGTKKLKITKHTSNGSTYDFVEICKDGKQKKITVHRLVWMARYKKLIPNGFDVDHANGKGGLFPHRIENLQLLKQDENRRKKQTDDDYVPF